MGYETLNLPIQNYMNHTANDPGSGIPQPDKMESTTRENSDREPGGGLWTSSQRKKNHPVAPEKRPNQSDWIDFVTSQPSWRDGPAESYLLRPDDELDAFVIDGVDDIQQLADEYGTVPRDNTVDLNWEAIANDLQALHITEEGARETETEIRLNDGDILSLRSWDVESTVFFEWCFDDVEHYGSFRENTLHPDRPQDERMEGKRAESNEQLYENRLLTDEQAEETARLITNLIDCPPSLVNDVLRGLNNSGNPSEYCTSETENSYDRLFSDDQRSTFMNRLTQALSEMRIMEDASWDSGYKQVPLYDGTIRGMGYEAGMTNGMYCKSDFSKEGLNIDSPLIQSIVESMGIKDQLQSREEGCPNALWDHQFRLDVPGDSNHPVRIGKHRSHSLDQNELHEINEFLDSISTGSSSQNSSSYHENHEQSAFHPLVRDIPRDDSLSHDQIMNVVDQFMDTLENQGHSNPSNPGEKIHFLLEDGKNQEARFVIQNHLDESIEMDNSPEQSESTPPTRSKSRNQEESSITM